MNINSDYTNAMSSPLSGAFVPNITPKPAESDATAGTGAAGAAGATPSFKDTVKSYLDGVNEQVTSSDALSRDLATGKTNDVSKVATSVEEANLAMEFTLAVRNKLLDAYHEIDQMQM